jgi:acetylornithine deacetylase
MRISNRQSQVLSDLIAIDSVNPSADPAHKGERDAAEYLADLCRGIGLDVQMYEVLPERPNLLAHLEVPGARHRVIFVGHTDTVPPGDMTDPFKPRLVEGRMIGRGACDDKGPLVAALAAMERLVMRRQELRVNVTFAAVIDEESTSAGAKALAAMNLPCAGAIVLEGTDLLPVVAHRGSLRLRLHVLGRAAHSAQPHLGVNAVGQMARVIQHLDTIYAPTLAHKQHPLAGPATVAVTRIQGGVSGNVIPPRCSITINRRFLPGETQESIFAELEAVLQDLHHQNPDLQWDPFEVEDWDESLDTPVESPIVRAALQAAAGTLGSAQAMGAAWCSDAPIISRSGIPSVVLGPGSVATEGHTRHESIPLKQVEQCAHIYEDLVLAFAGHLHAV